MRRRSRAAREPAPVPRATALGSLVHYITHAEAKNFQPANITFDLLEPLDEEMRKKGPRQEGAASAAVRAGAGGVRRVVEHDAAPAHGTSQIRLA